MSYDPKAIANYFLDKADSSCAPLSPMKLQKLVYYANGWYLALLDAPLIDEPIEAWSYGPVIKSLYREFRAFGNRPIAGLADDLIHDEARDATRVEPSIFDDGDDGVTSVILDRIWEVYGGYTAIQLSNMTHAAGTPWEQIMHAHKFNCPKHTRIPDDTIKRYFAAQLAPVVEPS